jgi:hypothetical protein
MRRAAAGGQGPLSIAAVLALSLVAGLAAPSSAAVGTWGPVQRVGTVRGGNLADAEMRTRSIVVGQGAPSDGPGTQLRLFLSSDSGASFRGPFNVRQRTRQGAVSVCGDGTPIAVYGRRPTDAETWIIEQSIRTGGESWNRRTLTVGNERPRHPDTACEENSGSIWSAWLSYDSGRAGGGSRSCARR